MKQVLHIFTKDVRRFWPEISISLALTAGYALLAPLQWKTMIDFANPSLHLLPGLLSLLVPVSWWVLIARVIHEERLVGDTQFWITRPYEWKRLLGSKVLFLLAFLCLPLFLAQSLMLAEAGFQPLALLHGLLYSLFLCAVIIVLPLAAFAVITANFARMTLAMLGVLLAVAVGVTVAMLRFFPNGAGMPFPLRDGINILIYMAGVAIAIPLAYALRKPWLSRLLLIAVPILAGSICLFASHFDRAQVEHRYPATHDAAPIQLGYVSGVGFNSYSASSTFRRPLVPLTITLAEWGVAQDKAILPDGVRAELTGPDGSHWESEWNPLEGFRFLPGYARFSTGVMIPVEVYNKFHSKPVHVRLTFAVSEAKLMRESVVALSQDNFAVPDFGECAAQALWGFSDRFRDIHCLSPLRQPALTYIATHWSSESCPAGNSGAEDGPVGDSWVGSVKRAAADFNISPVAEQSISFSNNTGYRSEPRFLCPGTPIHFRQYGLERRTQASLDIPGFQLPEATVVGNVLTLTNHTTSQPAK
jgi:hypothetical protein